MRVRAFMKTVIDAQNRMQIMLLNTLAAEISSEFIFSVSKFTVLYNLFLPNVSVLFVSVSVEIVTHSFYTMHVCYTITMATYLFTYLLTYKCILFCF